MKEFLKKYLSEEALKQLEEDYKKANPDAQGLPVYVGKKRLDEEIDKKKAIQAELEAIKKENENLMKYPNENQCIPIKDGVFYIDEDYGIIKNQEKTKGGAT